MLPTVMRSTRIRRAAPLLCPRVTRASLPMALKHRSFASGTPSAVTMASLAVTDSTSDALVQTAEASAGLLGQLGYLKSMGLCNFTPVGGVQALLEMTQVTTGMPWWATIAATTIAIRALLLPLVVHLQQNTSRIQLIRPEMESISARLKRAQTDGDYVALSQHSAELRELFAKNNARPGRLILVPLIQAPVMISFFLALRKMSEVPLVPFENGGMLWFANLNLADPTYALPVMAGAGFLAIFELGTEAGTTAGMTRNMKLFMRGMSVAMIPVTASLPASVFVYWITSNLFSMAQIVALRAPAVRRLVGLPLLPKGMK